MVKTNELLTPQRYLEMVTGRVYLIESDNDIEFINQILKENGLNILRNYPLDEIGKIVNNNSNVVLVDCLICDEGDGGMKHILRWFEVQE